MNMKALHSLAFIAALAAGTVYADACKTPPAPGKLPNGKTATEEQMATAHKSVKDFDTATNEYISCLQTDGAAQIAKLTETDPKKLEKQKGKISDAVVKKQNAAVDKDQALAAKFNEQVKAFKAKTAAQ